MAGRYDFGIAQGDSVSRTFTWKDGNGDPVNLTGYTAKLEVKNRRSDNAALITLQVGSGITLGGVSGTIAVTMTDEQTAALNVSSAYYALELYKSDGTTKRLVEGYMSIEFGDIV